jgi:hypothetical protein
MVLKRLLQWHGFSAVAPTWPSGARGTQFFRGWGAAQMGSFEAILLIASSSTALFWLAIRMG